MSAWRSLRDLRGELVVSWCHVEGCPARGMAGGWSAEDGRDERETCTCRMPSRADLEVARQVALEALRRELAERGT